jgi:hypothetical protein
LRKKPPPGKRDVAYSTAESRACESCIFRPTEYNGFKLDRANTDTCDIFEDPETKPDDVYWDGAECEYYGSTV